MNAEFSQNGHGPSGADTWRAVVSHQVNRFVELGYHDALGQSEAEYRQGFTVSEGFRQPEDYMGRFDNLLLVDPRVPFNVRNNAVNVTEYIEPKDIIDLADTPKSPYAIWVGKMGDKDTDAEAALNGLSGDEVPLTYQEALSFYSMFPGLLHHEGIFAASSRYENEVPVIKNLLSVAGLTRSRINDKFSHSRVVTRGKEETVLGI